MSVLAFGIFNIASLVVVVGVVVYTYYYMTTLKTDVTSLAAQTNTMGNVLNTEIGTNMQQANQEISDLDGVYAKKTSDMTTDYNTKFTTTKADYDGKFATTQADYNQKFADTKTDYDGQIATTQADYNSKFDATKKDYTTQIANTNNAMNTGFASLTAKVNQDYADLNTAFTGLSTDYSTFKTKTFPAAQSNLANTFSTSLAQANTTWGTNLQQTSNQLWAGLSNLSATNTTNLAKISALQTALASQVAQQQALAAQMNATLGSDTNGLSQLSQQIAQTAQNVTTLQNNIKTLQNDMTSANAGQNQFAQTAQGQITTVQSEIDALKASLASQQTAITTAATTQTSSTNNLQGEIAALQATISSLTPQSAAAAQSQNASSTALAQLQGALTALQTATTQTTNNQASQIAQLTTQLNSLGTQVTNLGPSTQSGFTNLQGQITAAQALITQNNNAVTAAITTQTAALAQLQAQVKALGTTTAQTGSALTPAQISQLNALSSAIIPGGSTGLQFNNDGTGLVWGKGYSKIYDNADLHIETDDNMWMSAPAKLDVATPNMIVHGHVQSDAGFAVNNGDPGPLVEKNYGSAGDRYGIGQYPNGTVQVYGSGKFGNASVNVGFANADGSFTDYVSVYNQPNNSATVSIGKTDSSSATRIGNAWMPYADGSVYLRPQAGKNVVIGDQGSKQTANVYIGDTAGGTTPVLVGGPNTWFPYPGDGNTYIRSSQPNKNLSLGDYQTGVVNIGGNGNTTNLNSATTNIPGNLVTPAIARNDGDWLRISGTPANGTAMYNSVSINDGGGLNVGEWAKVEAGRIKTQKLQLGEKWLLSGVGDGQANDAWLRLTGLDGKAYYGGLAADTMYTTNGKFASDARLKENIQTIPDNDLNKLDTLRSVQYNFKADEDKTKKYGFVAQELQNPYPHLVSDGPDGTLALDYNGVIPLVVGNVQDLKKKLNNDQLCIGDVCISKNELAALKRQLRQ